MTRKGETCIECLAVRGRGRPATAGLPLFLFLTIPELRRVTRLTEVSVRDRPAGRGRPSLPRYDQALRQAVNEKKQIRLHLAVETDFAPDAVIVGQVLEVDKYDLKMVVLKGDELAVHHIWIKKAMIVGTEIL